MQSLNVQSIQQLEDEAWSTEERRRLYATRHIPGYPWHTVVSPPAPLALTSAETSATHATSPSTPLFSLTVRRHVIPYNFDFTVFVKGRWLGKHLLDVYADELTHHSRAYYEACLRDGRLRCAHRASLAGHNTQRKSLKRESNAARHKHSTANFAPNATPQDTAGVASSATPLSSLREFTLNEANVVLQHGDVVYHAVHRHEIPVTVGVSGADPILLSSVHITRYGLLCVQKPTGLPTHATGRYFYNTVMAVLEYVLAPRRLKAWLIDDDPLLQSLVSTQTLSAREKTELYDYYSPISSSTFTSAETTPEKEKKKSALEGKEEKPAAKECSTDENEVEPAKLPRPCHRLDKVTSGVLLLAVSQAAAKRIGDVLMSKSKDVDAAVTAQLALRNYSDREPIHGKSTEDLAHRPTGRQSDAPLPAPLQYILQQTFDMQKHYLARVTTSQASAETLFTNATAWPLPPSAACLQAHNTVARKLISQAGNALPERFLDVSVDDHGDGLPMFPGGVLSTLPMPACDSAPAEHEAKQVKVNQMQTVVEGGAVKQRTKGTAPIPPSVSTSAATLLQRIPFLHNALSAQPTRLPPSESLILCTPYTGRLHQIRFHLSALGCPIVGDVVYSSSPRTSGDAGDPVMAQSMLRNENKEEAYIYFDESLLPLSYRRFCAAAADAALNCDGGKEGMEEEVGSKRYHSHSASGTISIPIWSANSTADHSSKKHAGDSSPEDNSARASEPRCYECAGRLPIVATHDCATGTAGICLHAWVYEVRESLLLPTVEGDTAVATCVSDCVEGRVTMDTVRDGLVRFVAPPPLWARAERGDSDGVAAQ